MVVLFLVLPSVAQQPGQENVGSEDANFALDKEQIKSMMSICRNRIACDREAHGTKTVPWLPACIGEGATWAPPACRLACLTG